MRTHHIAPYDQLEPRHGVLVVDGYGIKLRIQTGHLVVEDGIGASRRSRRFNRATHGLSRLVLLGHTGYVTLEAIRWLADLRIGLIHLDADGRVLSTSAAAPAGDPRLRRAQALAMTAPYGISIARTLLRDKIGGQLGLACQVAPSATNEIEACLGLLDGATTLDELLLIEATAAGAYWQAWATIPVQFARNDLPKVPEHWLTVGNRNSRPGGTWRGASTPAHALVNYVTALAEAETRIACHAAGLDPTMGILHADKAGRESLIYDLIEPARPAVESYVLDLLSNHRFRARDFAETRIGVCRVLPPLTHTLAETLPTWTAAMPPIVAGVARSLTEAAPRIDRVSTPLHRPGKAPTRAARQPRPLRTPVAPPRPTTNCMFCGGPAVDGGNFCPECRQQRQAERFPVLHQQGLDALAQARAEGRDPAHGSQAAHKRGAANANHQRHVAAWNHDHPQPDIDDFRRDILPGLRDRNLAELMKATGLSRPYCAMIRRGARIPHPRHWPALRAQSWPGSGTRHPGGSSSAGQ